jgi:hypothetical protein
MTPMNNPTNEFAVLNAAGIGAVGPGATPPVLDVGTTAIDAMDEVVVVKFSPKLTPGTGVGVTIGLEVVDEMANDVVDEDDPVDGEDDLVEDGDGGGGREED